MRQTYYQAYQQVLESTKKRIESIKDVSNNKFVKPYKVKRTVGEMNKIDEIKKQSYKHATEEESDSEIIRQSKDGIPVNKKAKDFIRAKDMNADFRGETKSPFYTELKGRCTPKSGIFSSDENSVFAALEHGVPSNKAVQSKLINIGDYYTLGITKSEKDYIDIGMIDALCLQCWTGNYNNVKLILKHGYDVPSSYSGLNPITAAIDGKNIEVLKLVLSVPKILDLVNKKDGLGNYPLEAVAKMQAAIDPYEFAKVLIEAGARDDNRNDKSSYNAAMLTVMGGKWTPNLFAELLAVTDLEKTIQGGMDLRTMAEKVGNREAVIMIDNYLKYQDDSINANVTHSNLINHI